MREWSLRNKIAASLLGICVAYLSSIYTLALIPREKLIGNSVLPIELRGRNHDDYLFGKYIPRAWTSASFVEPPIQLFGNQKTLSHARDGHAGPSPLPQQGEWQISFAQEKKRWPIFVPYFAFTTKSGWHFRIGCRWDVVDHYYTIPTFALKKISGPQ